MTHGGRGAHEAPDADAGRSGPPTPAADAPKTAWRAWAHARRRAWAADAARRARDEAAVHALLAGWGAWRGAELALVYLAFGDELDPLPASARSAAPADGPRLATTRTVGARALLELRAWTPPFERHAFGFDQPRLDARPIDPAEVDLVLVPGLAFDVHGARLGHGQGHYDRLLPWLPERTLRVGVAPDALVVERIPTEAHDVVMTHLLTPSGFRAIVAR